MTDRRDIRPSITVQEVRVVHRLVYIQLHSRVGIGGIKVKILGRRKTRLAIKQTSQAKKP